jgi:GT2 family glycosyltransferase
MTKKDVQISVIIPTYNRSRVLEHTIRSLVAQDLPKKDFEVIIADDGSCDDTLLMIRRYENILNITYCYQTDKGYRPASARNMGIRTARGKICLFIDSGIIVKKNCLRTHVEFHEKARTDIAIIGYTYGYTQHGETEDELLSLIDPADADRSIEKLVECGRFLDVREKVYRKYNDKISGLRSVWTLFWGGHLSVPTNILRQVGGFDEQFDGNWGCEDNDLGYRLQQQDIAIFFCREAQVLHLPHGTNLELKTKEGHINCRRFHNKYLTAETGIFLDYYLKEITGQEVIDFNEIFIRSAESIPA